MLAVSMSHPESNHSSAEPLYDVVWPLGRTSGRTIETSGALGALDGKTVAFLWDYVFKGAEMFEIVKGEIDARYQDVTYVDYDVFGDIHGSVTAEREAIGGLVDKLRQYRVDAAIVGVGA
jgi:hypothetical protein